MQIFFKSRESARKADFGSKVVDNGHNATKRWGASCRGETVSKRNNGLDMCKGLPLS